VDLVANGQIAGLAIGKTVSHGHVAFNWNFLLILPDRIQEHRIEAIGHIITIVHDHIDKYFISDILCSRGKQFACDAIFLGSLLKSSIDIGIWPRPEVPYYGMTFKNLASKVREMRVLDKCNQDQRQRSYYNFNQGYGVKEDIDALINSLETHFSGHKLDSFRPETWGNRNSEKKYKKGKDKKKQKRTTSIVADCAV
jgi:hypothetical protein